jgi:hypothetical protein
VDNPDGIEELGTRGSFEQVTLGASPNGAQDALIGVEGGKNHDPNIWPIIPEQANSLNAIHARHLEV